MTSTNSELIKAFGGCTNCYGKGYATVNDRWHGHGTDGDIGGFEGYISGGDSNAMKFCKCDRGTQLAQHLNKQIKQANQLAETYARIIARVYDGERIEDVEPEEMNKLRTTK